MKKYMGKIIGGIVILAIVLWIVFFVINNKRDNSIFSNRESGDKEVEYLISKDLDGFYYPSSSREVVKLYQRYHKCLVNNTYTDEEFAKLVDQIRKLLDPELLENNPRDKHLEACHDEVAIYRKAKKSITVSNIQIESLAQKYTTDKGDKMSSIVGYYVVTTSGGGVEKSYERFILREDENGRYRILGFEIASEKDFGD